MTGFGRIAKGPARISGLTIIELMIVITIVSIITIIAIPVYQQYAARAKITEGMNLAAPLLNGVAEYYQSNNRWPDSNAAAGAPPPSEYETDFVESIEVSVGDAADGTITITYKTSGITELTGSTNTLVYTPSVDSSLTVEWDCDAGTIPTWGRPPRCR